VSLEAKVRYAAEPVDRHVALAVRSHCKAAVEMHCGISSEETVVSASPQLGRVFDFLVEAARASMHELVTQVFDFNGQFSTLIARNKLVFLAKKV
jgi:altronate dehydratase